LSVSKSEIVQTRQSSILIRFTCLNDTFAQSVKDSGMRFNACHTVK